MSTTYSDVDGSGDPRSAVQWQDEVDRWPQVRAYKARVDELLADAEAVLDIGCGPGSDLASRRARRRVGLDRSQVMCAAAVERGATVCRGDGQDLPFRDGAFDGVSADRVLQHVAQPSLVLDESERVLRPGGRLVVVDPDQETLVIHVPGVRRELSDRIKALRRDIGYRNGRLVSGLPAVLVDRGWTEVAIEPFPLTITDPDRAFGLPGWPALWRDEGGFTDAEVDEWQRGVDHGRRGGFVYSLLYFVVTARRP